MEVVNKFGRTVYKGKWGWHSTDYATCVKLKTLSKAYWTALALRAALKRWERKQPQNRKTRPAHDPIHGIIIESGVMGEFNKARIPSADPDLVLPKKLTIHQIDDLLAQWESLKKKPDLAA